MLNETAGIDLKKVDASTNQKAIDKKAIDNDLDDRNALFVRVGLLLYVRLFAFLVGTAMVAINIFIYSQDKDVFKLVLTMISSLIPFIFIFILTRVIQASEARIADINLSLQQKINPD